MPDGVTASVGKSVLSAIRGPGTVMDGRQAHEIKVGLAVLRRAAARPGMPQKSRGCVTYRPLRCNLGALRPKAPRSAAWAPKFTGIRGSSGGRHRLPA